ILLWDFADPEPDDETIRQKFGKGSATSGGAADPKAISAIGHQKQFEDFLAAIKEGKTPAVDGYQGRKSVELILAIYESSWTGRRVSLPLSADPKRPD